MLDWRCGSTRLRTFWRRGRAVRSQAQGCAEPVVDEGRKIDLIADLPAAAFTTDADGRVIRYNSAAVALWGRTPGPEVRWTGAARLLNAAGSVLDPAESPAARTCREGQPPKELGMLFVERPDGSQTAYLSRPSLLHDADGEIAGVIELMLDPHPRELIDIAAVRLAAIVSGSSDLIVGLSLDGRVASWNDGATRLFGWRPQEMLGASILRIIPPELHQEDENALAALRRGEQLKAFDTVRIAKDGRRIAVSLTVSPIRNAAGRLVGASKIAREISSGTAAVVEPDQQIEELNHRVRNTLATIQAIADQSLQLSPSPEAFTRSFANRVQALARVHDLLLAGEMAGADISAIVRAELPVTDFGMRVAADGPAVMLEPRVAVQMALVLHELADNARRHGALAGSSGRVTVDWRIEAGPGDLRLVLVWSESAPGLALSEASPGCGFLLIERSLAVSGGTAMRRAKPGRFVWEIELPLPGLPAVLPGDAPPPSDFATYSQPAAMLDGHRVLVVEDEPLIALDIANVLADGGATVLGPVGIMDAALELIETRPLDAALLDATLAGEPVYALAAALHARRVPFAFVSGGGLSRLPEDFRNRPLLSKPFTPEELMAVVGKLIAPAEGTTVIRLRRRE